MCDLIFITSVLSALQAQSYHLTLSSRISENFFLESGILGFGIRNTAQGIRNRIQNPPLENQNARLSWFTLNGGSRN